MEKKIGFVGLGVMGKWMALNIIKAGFNLSFLDINPHALRFLIDQGAKAAASPEELSARAEWIFLSLPNTALVEEVIFGEKGLIHGARTGTYIVDCGTTGYLQTIEFERRLEERGIIFVDAPVSGMEARAKEGTLTMMFGGGKTLFEQLMPVFGAMSNKVLHMGQVGSGQLTKLVNQLLFNISCAAIAEVLPMAAKLCLDPEKVIEVVTSGTGRSFAAEFFAPLALEGIFDEGYALKHAYKDMITAAEISAHHKLPLPMVSACTTIYQMALAQGLGDEGKGSMIKVFEKLMGAKFRKQKEEV